MVLVSNGFWAEAISKAVGRERKLPPPTIPQQPAEPEQAAGVEDYLAKAREAIPTAQGVSVEERFSRPVEYVRPDGSKISVPSRDSSDITVRQGNSSWETNSRPVQTDSGLFGNATPQERAAAMQMANRDGRYSPVGNAPWARRAMLQDAIQNGDFTEAGHGDGGVFSEA